MWAACQNGHVKCVDALIRLGADMEKVQTDTGMTPLFMASQNGHRTCVEALVSARADLTLAWEGQTPLAAATQKGHADIVSVLQAAVAVKRSRAAAEATD